VDASTSFQYVKLGNPATIVSVADPSTSSAWDLALFATTVTLNGGQAGPGGVTGFCICENAAATTAQIQAMTADNQLASFEAIGETAVPGDASFVSDALAPAIEGWFDGTGAAVTVHASRSWLLRSGTTNVILGKFRVTNIQNASVANAGQITFEYALQSTTGGAFGAPVTKTVDVTSGPVYFDLTAGAVSTAASWDLRFSGFEIRSNGGVSGPGSVMAVVDNTTPFSNIDAAYASTAPPQAYRKDSYSGVFAASPWYKYNITGTDNQIWPLFNTYLVKRGTEVFKVQLTSYYNTTGTSRQITIRYKKIK
jgi:hypothetical protein